MDARDEGKKTINNVCIIWEFPNVFLGDFSEVPLKRQDDFQIDWIPGVVAIAKAPYLLASQSMQELST